MSDDPTRAGRDGHPSRARRGMLLPEALEQAGARRRRRTRRRAAPADPRHPDRGAGGPTPTCPPSARPTRSDPIQALHAAPPPRGGTADAEFHLAVTSIVTGLRDAHTRYIGPLRCGTSVAVLPFLVEQYGPDQRPRYRGQQGRRDAEPIPESGGLRRVSRSESWNGIPIARAVEILRRPRDRRPTRCPTRPRARVAHVPGPGVRAAAGRALGRSSATAPRGAARGPAPLAGPAPRQGADRHGRAGSRAA